MLQYIIALVVILGFMGVFVWRPTVGTYIKYTLWTLPFTSTKILPLDYGFIRVFDVLAVTAVLFLFREFVTLRSRRDNLGYVLVIVVFIGLTLLGKFFSAYPQEKLYMLYPLFTIFIFTRFFIHYLYEDFERRYELLRILKFGFGLAMLFILLQIVIGPSITYYTEIHNNAKGESFSTTRFPGLFLDSQTNGQFLAMASFLFLLMPPNAKKLEKYLGYALFGAMGVSVVLAGSRAALGGFLLGCVLFFLMAKLKTKIVLGTLGIFSVLVIFLAKPNAAIFGRTDNLGEDYNFREAIWEETFGMIAKHPIWGIGMANYEKYIMTYHQDLNIVIEPGVEYYFFRQPENGYLKIMVDQGIPAFVLFFAMVAYPLLRSGIGWLNGRVNGEVKYVICSALAFMVAFNTVYTLLDYRLACLFTLLISLALLYSNKGRAQNGIRHHLPARKEVDKKSTMALGTWPKN
ncbi:O-antigen ligase family protein [Maribacter sp. 2307ULW6-5]|uniref:O-antigen ligase family protein n=1 Tax=Maribacter sp. 2307ULW6-5 TaxID=3386275 RepID=UPI0039BCE98B